MDSSHVEKEETLYRAKILRVKDLRRISNLDQYSKFLDENHSEGKSMLCFFFFFFVEYATADKANLLLAAPLALPAQAHKPTSLRSMAVAPDEIDSGWRRSFHDRHSSIDRRVEIAFFREEEKLKARSQKRENSDPDPIAIKTEHTFRGSADTCPMPVIALPPN
jgi:hypothetical protein